jgi:hypothetical protein
MDANSEEIGISSNCIAAPQIISNDTDMGVMLGNILQVVKKNKD